MTINLKWIYWSTDDFASLDSNSDQVLSLLFVTRKKEVCTIYKITCIINGEGKVSTIIGNIYDKDSTPAIVKINKDKIGSCFVICPVRTNAPSIVPHVNIPGSTVAMPSQEFFAQLIETMKNIKAPQQPSKIVVKSRDHKESVNLAKLQNGMLQLMYATGNINWDDGTVKYICTVTFAQSFMNLLSRLAAVQATSLANLFNTIFTSKQEDKDSKSAFHPLDRLMSLVVFPQKFVKRHLNAIFQSLNLKSRTIY